MVTSKIPENLFVFILIILYVFLLCCTYKRLFSMVIQSLYVKDLQKVSGHSERKICAVGVTRCLTESQKMLSDYKDLWYVLFFSYLFPLNPKMPYCGAFKSVFQRCF